MSTSRRAKPAQRALAITEHAQLHQVNAQPSRLAQMLEQPGKPTKLQRRIAVETVTRAGSIEATGLLHEWASQNVARAHVISQHHVYQTVSRLNAVMTMPMDPVTAADMSAWTTAQKDMLFRHEASLLDGMVTNIVKLATTPLPEADEPTGILGWLRERW